MHLLPSHCSIFLTWQQPLLTFNKVSHLELMALSPQQSEQVCNKSQIPNPKHRTPKTCKLNRCRTSSNFLFTDWIEAESRITESELSSETVQSVCRIGCTSVCVHPNSNFRPSRSQGNVAKIGCPIHVRNSNPSFSHQCKLSWNPLSVFLLRVI